MQTIEIHQQIQLVDVQINYLDDSCEYIFIEIRLKQDNRMEKAVHQIDTSHRAEAILEFDDKLKVYHCNKLFYQIFGVEKATCTAHFDNAVSEAFRLAQKAQLMNEIKQGLIAEMTYYTEVEIITMAGDKHW